MELVNYKYRLLEQIGSGCFGTIYKGLNIRTNEYVAIKMEHINSTIKLLKNESKIYTYLKECDCIPPIKWFGKDNYYYYMVMPLLGYSVRDVLHKKGHFSPALVLKIGIKLINILSIIHTKGLVHRDIKPDNFLFSKDNPNILYLIDFGFCTPYMESGRHIQMTTTHNMIGSPNYASIMAHKRHTLSRRDDLESLGYMLLCLHNGYLPWVTMDNEDAILQAKLQVTTKRDTEDGYQYPDVLIEFIKYVRLLSFEETPNYCLVTNTFERKIEFMRKTN